MAEEATGHAPTKKEYPPVPVLKTTTKVMTEKHLEALAKGRKQSWLKKQQQEKESKGSEEKKEKISEEKKESAAEKKKKSKWVLCTGMSTGQRFKD